jgi:hypothetical protein
VLALCFANMALSFQLGHDRCHQSANAVLTDPNLGKEARHAYWYFRVLSNFDPQKEYKYTNWDNRLYSAITIQTLA